MSTRPRRASSRAPSTPQQTPLTPSRTKSNTNANANKKTNDGKKRRRQTTGGTGVEGEVEDVEEEGEEGSGEGEQQSTTANQSTEDVDMTNSASKEGSSTTASVEGEDDESTGEKSSKVSRTSVLQSSPSYETPSRPSASSTATSPASPNLEFGYSPAKQSLLRMKRMEEKNELQELNKRLELYILRRRERDASQGGLNAEIQILKDKFKNDLTQEKQFHEHRYEELKKQKLDLSNQLQELQDANSKLAQQSKDHLASSNLYKARCADLEKRLKKVDNELAELKKRNIELENQVKKLSVDYEEEREAHLLLKDQLSTQKSALTLAQKQLNVVQSKANTYLQDLEALQASSEEEQSLLNKQLSILRQENQTIEDQLRREFGVQLQNILAERQLQSEKERDEQIARLKAFYEHNLDDKNMNIIKLTQELQTVTHSYNAVSKELAEERKSNASAAAIKADYERQVAKLHEVIEQQRERFELQLTSKTEQLSKAQTTITTKELEFQQLMDVKIALDMEIAQYNQLLNTEENRLGFEVPASLISPAKGRRASMTAPKSVRKATTTTTTTTTTSSSRRQSGATLLSVTSTPLPMLSDVLSLSVNASARKFTLTNQSADGEVSLQGITIASVNSRQTHSLPSAILGQGESISIITPNGRATESPTNIVTRWEADERSLWQDGETIELKDSKGNVFEKAQIRV